MAQSYVVQHTMVGVHRLGDVVTFAKDDIEKVGVDVKRLLHLGALREASSEEAGNATPYGTTNEELITPIPPVPFDTTLTPVLDPLRTENPPTLPQAGVPDHTTEIRGTVSDKPKRA